MLSGLCFSTVRQDISRLLSSCQSGLLPSFVGSERQTEWSYMAVAWTLEAFPDVGMLSHNWGELTHFVSLNHSDARTPWSQQHGVSGVCVSQSVAFCSSPFLFVSLPWSVSHLWSHTIGIDDFVYFHQILTLQLSFKEGEMKQARGG